MLALTSLTRLPVPPLKLAFRSRALPFRMMLPLPVVEIGPLLVIVELSMSCTLPPPRLLIPVAFIIKAPILLMATLPPPF